MTIMTTQNHEELEGINPKSEIISRENSRPAKVVSHGRTP